MASLLRQSSAAKAAVQAVIPSLVTQNKATQEQGGAFFVPADGGGPPEEQKEEAVEEEEDPQTLLQTISEHLSLSFLSRSKAFDRGDGREEREWDRLLVGYLCLLSQWLWENPRGVREFLEAGGLSVVKPLPAVDF